MFVFCLFLSFSIHGTERQALHTKNIRLFFFLIFVIKDSAKKGDLMTVFGLHNGFEITYV